jgi:hypothetical protein
LKSEEKMTKYVITANRLNNGLVVYMSKDGSWGYSIFDALVLVTDEDMKGYLALANVPEQMLTIVGPYEVEVSESVSSEIFPLRYRERIRAYGPSTHADFSRQDVLGHLTHLDGVSPIYFNGVS